MIKKQTIGHNKNGTSSNIVDMRMSAKQQK